jgi:5-methylcytosine-specific restriction enzyme A
MTPGDRINNSELMKEFAVGISGGMRKSNTKNCLVIVSDHTKGAYDDRWEEDILHYTGMGLKGPQVLDYSQNDTLSKSTTNGVTVHLFEVFDEGEYIYAGEVELVDKPYSESQPDQDGRTA